MQAATAATASWRVGERRHVLERRRVRALALCDRLAAWASETELTTVVAVADEDDTADVATVGDETVRGEVRARVLELATACEEARGAGGCQWHNRDECRE